MNLANSHSTFNPANIFLGIACFLTQKESKALDLKSASSCLEDKDLREPPAEEDENASGPARKEEPA
jgi:hypothetical protein